MILREIVAKQDCIDDYNIRCEQMKTEYPEYDWEGRKIETIYDRFQPYVEWVKYLYGYMEHNGLDWNLIKDKDAYDINYVFVGGLNEHNDLREFTDYKLINDWRQEDYGVCDNADQVIALYNEHVASGRFNENTEYLIYLTPIFKEYEDRGGWRWHKWGEYIGVQDSVAEYICDEPNIDLVYVFYIRGLE